jgi:hypothetical protein
MSLTALRALMLLMYFLALSTYYCSWRFNIFFYLQIQSFFMYVAKIAYSAADLALSTLASICSKRSISQLRQAKFRIRTSIRIYF